MCDCVCVSVFLDRGIFDNESVGGRWQAKVLLCRQVNISSVTGACSLLSAAAADEGDDRFSYCLQSDGSVIGRNISSFTSIRLGLW